MDTTTYTEKWMRVPNAQKPYTAVFRGEFFTVAAEKRMIEFSADECCQLYLDGQWLCNGPEHGTDKHWFFQRQELELAAGPHILCIRQFAFGELAPMAQMSISDGVFVRNLDADWSWQLESLEYVVPFPDWGAFPRICLNHEYNPLILRGGGGVWNEVEFFEDSRPLCPPALPPMRHAPVAPRQVSSGLYCFDTYTCADVVYHFDGQGVVKVRWAEAPYKTDYVNPDTLKGEKKRRDGKFFYGKWDVFEINGPLDWPSLAWHAGRYIQIECNGTATCTFSCYETGYPFPQRHFESPLMQAAYRTLQCCSSDTFMDCPFYERMMYIGDARIESLCIYHLTDDHRLPAKALRILADGQREDGALPSRYPCHVIQYIPSFMFLWLLALNDYFKIHGHDALVCELLPTGQRLLEYAQRLEMDGLIMPGDDWNFIDWCDGWNFGAPVGNGPNCVLNFFYAMGMQAYGETSGKPEYADRAQSLLQRIHEVFFDAEARLYSDFADLQSHSEHAQTLALLCGAPEASQLISGLLQHIPAPQCSIYFSFYYLQACRKFGLASLFDERMTKYSALLDFNLTTLPEEFGNPRSDCHAWSSHILLNGL